MLRGNVVFYCVFELVFAEGEPCDPLDLVVSECSGQYAGQYHVPIESQLVSFAVLFNFVTYGIFDITLYFYHIESGAP